MKRKRRWSAKRYWKRAFTVVMPVTVRVSFRVPNEKYLPIMRRDAIHDAKKTLKWSLEGKSVYSWSRSYKSTVTKIGPAKTVT